MAISRDSSPIRDMREYSKHIFRIANSSFLGHLGMTSILS